MPKRRTHNMNTVLYESLQSTRRKTKRSVPRSTIKTRSKIKTRSSTGRPKQKNAYLLKAIPDTSPINLFPHVSPLENVRNRLTTINREDNPYASNVNLITGCKFYAAKMISVIGAPLDLNCSDETLETPTSIAQQFVNWLTERPDFYRIFSKYFYDLFDDNSKLSLLYKGIERETVYDILTDDMDESFIAYNVTPFDLTPQQLVENPFEEKIPIMVILSNSIGGQSHNVHHAYVIIMCDEQVFITSSWGCIRGSTKKEWSRRPKKYKQIPWNEYDIPTIRSNPGNRMISKQQYIEFMRFMISVKTYPLSHEDSQIERGYITELFGLTPAQSRYGVSQAPLRIDHIHLKLN
jgi:hypothetical protein